MDAKVTPILPKEVPLVTTKPSKPAHPTTQTKQTSAQTNITIKRRKGALQRQQSIVIAALFHTSALIRRVALQHVPTTRKRRKHVTRILASEGSIDQERPHHQSRKRGSPVSLLRAGPSMPSTIKRGSTLRLRWRNQRPPSVVQLLGDDRLEMLRKLFFICDVNQDNLLSPDEMEVVFEILQLRPQLAAAQTSSISRKWSRKKTAPDPSAASPVQRRKPTAIKFPSMSFEQFLTRYGSLVVEFGRLPADEFLARCKRLKLGFQKCDTDGNCFIDLLEFEIALQKLGVIVADEELLRAYSRLDRDGDGLISWSDLLLTAWTSADGTLDLAVDSTTRNESTQSFVISKLTIDALGDLPTVLLPQPSVTATDTTESSTSSKAPPVYSMEMLQLSLSQPTSRISKPASFLIPHLNQSTDPTKRWTMEQMGVKLMVGISHRQVRNAKSTRATTTASVSPTSKPINRFGLEETASSVTRQLPKDVPVELTQSNPNLVFRKAAPQPTTIRTGFATNVRRRIKRIEILAAVIAAILGILCGIVSSQCEQVLLKRYDWLNPGETLYYLYLVLINIGVSIFEVSGMYLTALVCAYQVTVCTGLVLYPLDREREFLARSIARAALQVAPRTDIVFGINPTKGVQRFSFVLLFLVQRYVLRFMIKFLIKRVLWRAVAKTVLNLIVLPINGVMDAYTLYRVMLACRVNIIGPPCAVAVLEHFFLEERDLASPFQRVDYLRVLGCVAVCKRCIPPNVELMINRMRQEWVHDGLWPKTDGCTCLQKPEEACLSHPLDDVNRLLVSLMLYASRRRRRSSIRIAYQHLRAMFFLLIIGLIIDGNLEWSERRLYIRACKAARMQNEWKAILRLKQEYVDGKGIQLNEVYAMIKTEKSNASVPEARQASDLDDSDVKHTPWRESLSYMLNRIARLLSV